MQLALPESWWGCTVCAGSWHTAQSQAVRPRQAASHPGSGDVSGRVPLLCALPGAGPWPLPSLSPALLAWAAPAPGGAALESAAFPAMK